MSKFIVIKKKNIFLCLLISLMLLALSFSFYYLCKDKKNIQSTISNISTNEDILLDFNGDGEKETLEVKKEKNTYVVKVKSSSKDYILHPSDNSKVLGEYNSSFPLNINALDLSRDGIPEIIIRTFKNNKSINYIFTWDKNNFSNVYTSSNNILGILDSNNSRTPKILSASSSGGDSSTNSYIFNGKTLKDTTFSKTNIPNLNLIQSFIDLIEAPYELSDTPDIFSSSIDSNELSLLWNLSKDTYNFAFQNGYFYDSSWDDNGNLTKINWCLSFEEIKKSDSSSTPKELLLYLTIENDSYNEFKISTIKKVPIAK